MPLAKGVMNKVSWDDLLDRMRRNLTNWALRPLNLARRVTLIKAVLQAMLIYLFSIMATPKVVLKELRSIHLKFIWGGTRIKKKWDLISRDMVCRLNGQGGPRIRDLRKNNEILGAKILWNWVFDKEEPWEKL